MDVWNGERKVTFSDVRKCRDNFVWFNLFATGFVIWFILPDSTFWHGTLITREWWKAVTWVLAFTWGWRCYFRGERVGRDGDIREFKNGYPQNLPEDRGLWLRLRMFRPWQ